MRGRIRGVSSYHREALASGWQFCSTPADKFKQPHELHDALAWRETTVPTTAAAALRANGDWSLDGPQRRFDADDWWFRCRFEAPPAVAPEAFTALVFEGLASVAEGWLNGTPLLSSENMFCGHDICVTGRLQSSNELVLRFRSLDALLRAKRPRPRWRAPMIEEQQLRWFRTTVLGRTPGWSPPAAAVGPWRGIWLEQRPHVDIAHVALQASREGNQGIVAVDVRLNCATGADLRDAELLLTHDGQQFRSALDISSSNLRGRICVPDPALWWPHTHGTPATYSASLRVTVRTADADVQCEVQLGPVGFRTVKVDTSAGGFAVHVNNVRIFCRGACWMPLDPVSLQSTAVEYERALDQVVAAGMNMLRVTGTTVYEDDEFLAACDRRGILLWQDFMFANMDFPSDAALLASIETEVAQQLARLGGHPCLAVLCGNSEVEQQAAMWGASRENWRNDLFHETLPELAKRFCPDILYWPSSAHGGDFPHRCDTGTTSYYGVGAYLRPIQDSQQSGVRFATECLAFANIPDDAGIARMPGGLSLKVHHPQWKARTPRDLGAGWDFEDVRDHYLRLLFDVDPMQLRYSDHDRYLELSRVVPGEAMAATFAQWRRAGSRCSGALIWFLRDLWAGAGWGIVAADGRPKAPYYYLQRALQPLALFMTDEGLNGLHLHLVNDLPLPATGSLTLRLYRHSVMLRQLSSEVAVEAHGAVEIPVATLSDTFTDLTHAYRFGTPPVDLVVAEFKGDGTHVECIYLPQGCARPVDGALALAVQAQQRSERTLDLVIRSERFAQSICIDAQGYLPNDNYFHIAPGGERHIVMTAIDAPRSFRGTVRALNGTTTSPISLASRALAP